MHPKLTFSLFRETDFTPESFAQTVEAVAEALPNLATLTFKAWQRAQSHDAQMYARCVVTGLHVYRWTTSDAFLEALAEHVWSPRHVFDPRAYAELRRFINVPRKKEDHAPSEEIIV